MRRMRVLGWIAVLPLVVSLGACAASGPSGAGASDSNDAAGEPTVSAAECAEAQVREFQGVLGSLKRFSQTDYSGADGGGLLIAGARATKSEFVRLRDVIAPALAACGEVGLAERMAAWASGLIRELDCDVRQGEIMEQYGYGSPEQYDIGYECLALTEENQPLMQALLAEIDSRTASLD